MRGFASRTTVEVAWGWIAEHAPVLSAESVPLHAAWGRTLAADVFAARNVPAFDRSAMDGYALRATETVGASDYNPLEFHIVGESLPGRAWNGQVERGQAVRIMTGAPLPTGADAVVPAEYASESGDQVAITASIPEGKHVGWVGEDIAEGSCVLRRGRSLRPQDVAVLASLGVPDVDVVRAPRVRLLVTGNELAQPGAECAPHQIYDSNSSLLISLLRRDGAELESWQVLPDDRELLRAALSEPGADVILVAGGSSVGAEDHAPSLIAELGKLAIHGVAMRPSSPAGMGTLGAGLVFLLPGNPVSCLCAYDFFAGRALRRMQGLTSAWPYVACQARLRKKITSAIGRVDYCRVRVSAEGVEPLALSGASILSSTTRADGFVIVPADLEGWPAGSEITVRLYDSTAAQGLSGISFGTESADV